MRDAFSNGHLRQDHITVRKTRRAKLNLRSQNYRFVAGEFDHRPLSLQREFKPKMIGGVAP
jgi:hypothetical protein